jgi:hypothetical protein
MIRRSWNSGLKKRIAIVVLLTILVVPLMLSNVTTNPTNTPPETCLAVRGYGIIEGQVQVKNFMGDYVAMGWVEVTATSLDGEFIAVDQTDGQGSYSLFVPAGESYNVSIYAPYHADPGRFWYDSKLVAVWTGIATGNFYINESEHLIPEFSDYAISFVITIAFLMSIFMIRRVKKQESALTYPTGNIQF